MVPELADFGPFGTVDPERTVLGALLAWPELVADDLFALVSEDDFRAFAHQKVYRHARDLWSARAPLTLVTVAERVQRAGQSDDISAYFLAALRDEGGAAGDCFYFAQLVRERAVLRRLAHAGSRIEALGSDPVGTADEMLSQASDQLMAVADARELPDDGGAPQLMGEAFDRLDAMMAGRGPTGLPTGFHELDRYTGGLQAGELYVVGARPSVGKTTFLLNLARQVMRNGVGVWFVTLEQSKKELADRLWSIEAGVPAQRLRSQNVNELEKVALHQAGTRIREWGFWPEASRHHTMAAIAMAGHRRKRRNKIGLGILDYLQLVAPEDRRARREEQVAAVSRRLKTLAGELGIPLIVAAQVNRAAEARDDRKPRLSDLRESGSIEADADAVLLLHRSESNPALVECNLAKHRNGPTGEFALYFRREYARFENHEDGEPV